MDVRTLLVFLTFFRDLSDAHSIAVHSMLMIPLFTTTRISIHLKSHDTRYVNPSSIIPSRKILELGITEA